jgi:hypothetical protein
VIVLCSHGGPLASGWKAHFGGAADFEHFEDYSLAF